MNIRLMLLVCLAAISGNVVVESQAGDWITAPSYYTHDFQGNRVQQYTPIGPFYIYPDPSYQRSGYRHTRSSLQSPLGIDHYHVVEEWGRPVRPYDEWRFPYRPYSVPYSQWGPPYAGLNQGWMYPPFPGGNGSFPGGVAPFPGYGYGGLQGPIVPYNNQPWFRDRW